MIKLTRIDHRLLHGQVAVAWTNYLQADCILIANDEVAESEFRKSTLRLAKPVGCKIVFKSVEDSAEAINSGVTDKYKLFVITETIKDARRLVEKCSHIKEIDLGLSQIKEGSKNLGKAVYATEEELEDLKKIVEKGVDIYIQSAPKDIPQSINQMVEKGQL